MPSLDGVRHAPDGERFLTDGMLPEAGDVERLTRCWAAPCAPIATSPQIAASLKHAAHRHQNKEFDHDLFDRHRSVNPQARPC
jgi:hypothetical protein